MITETMEYSMTNPPKYNYNNKTYKAYRDILFDLYLKMVVKNNENLISRRDTLSWENNLDGFFYKTRMGTVFTFKVLYDEKRVFNTEDPFVICIQYCFEIYPDSEIYYKQLAKYINDYYYNVIEQAGKYHMVSKLDDSERLIYMSSLFVSDLDSLLLEIAECGVEETLTGAAFKLRRDFRDEEKRFLESHGI